MALISSTALVAIGFAGTAVPANAATATDSENVDVSANYGWQDTGVSLESGQTVRISADGRWTVDHRNWRYWSGPNGKNLSLRPFCKEVKWLPYGMLIGRIGEDGPAFKVGSWRVKTAHRSGNLYLSINDAEYSEEVDGSCLDDNEGSVNATIRTYWN
jgi:hypothetical protein